MRVLGIDPGLTRCGVGVIEGDPGRPPALLLADVVRTPADAETGQRLAALERSLAGLVDVDTQAAELVRGTVRIAGALGITVVAEGVENQQQLALLRRAAVGWSLLLRTIFSR